MGSEKIITSDQVKHADRIAMMLNVVNRRIYWWKKIGAFDVCVILRKGRISGNPGDYKPGCIRTQFLLKRKLESEFKRLTGCNN